MKKRLALFFLFFWILMPLIVSCVATTPVGDSEEQSVIPSKVFTANTPTQISNEKNYIEPIRPTITLVPTNTTIPSLTPVPKTENVDTSATNSALSLNGPYLAYTKIVGNVPTLFLVSADGKVEKTFSFPEKSYVDDLKLSASGEWLAFYGDISPDLSDIEQLSPNFSLYLMHLPDGEIIKVTKLLPYNYPQNLDIIVEKAIQNDSEFAAISKENLLAAVRRSFGYSLIQAQWSPNGRYLAFSGAIDGPSSDLYVYEVQSQIITRLTDGPALIDMIYWFPDKNRILHSSSYAPCMGDCSQYYVVDLNKNIHHVVNFDTFGGATRFVGWSKDSVMTLFTNANISGKCCLRNFDFRSDRITSIYSGSFEDFAIDPKNGSMAISLINDLASISTVPGVYVQAGGDFKKVLDAPFYLDYIGWEAYNFVAYGGGVIAFNSNGQPLVVSNKEYYPVPSPNRLLLALIGQRNTAKEPEGMEVVNQKLELLFSLPKGHVQRVIWKPDSSGIFFITGHKLYYTGIPSQKDPVLIDDHISGENDATYMNFGWVR